MSLVNTKGAVIIGVSTVGEMLLFFWETGWEHKETIIMGSMSSAKLINFQRRALDSISKFIWNSVLTVEESSFSLFQYLKRASKFKPIK